MTNQTNKPKKKKYWLWGGIAGAVISIIYNIYSFICRWFFISTGGETPFLCKVAYFPNIFFAFGLLIFCFIIGALLGYIYGKIKGRKTK